MMSVKTCSLSLGVVVAAACGGTAPPPAEGPAPPAAPPTAASTPSSPASATASAPVPDAPKHAKSPFHLLVRAEHPLDLYPVGERLFVRSNGGIPLALVDGDRLIEDEKYGKGLEGFMGIRGIVGSWPDDAWAAITLSNGRVGWGGIRKWNGGSWATSGNDLGQRWIYAGLATWSGGLLALLYNVMPYDTNDTVRFKWLGSAKRPPLPVTTKTSCGTLVRASGFTALPTGEVFSAGATCDDDKFAIEWWKAGATRGQVERFDGPNPYNETYLLARTAKDVWVIGDAWKSAITVHFDGERFEVVKNPFVLPTISASLGSDGTLWVVTGQPFDNDKVQGTVWKRAPKHDWERVALPEGVTSPTSVHAAVDGRVWLAAGNGLYRTTPPAAQVQEVKWEWGRQFPGHVRIPKLATEGCKDIYVLMYGITKVTPKDYDFPLTRKAIKGHTELAGTRFAETEDNGKRYFGAFVPTLAMGKKIEKLVREKVKGSQPAVICFAPRVLRDIDIDLATGEVKK